MRHLHANGPLTHHPDSYYAAITPLDPMRPPLEGDTTADLAIIGAGLTGLAAAFFAAQAGLDVRVLEAARVGWGASGRNGGQIGSGFNWDQRKLSRYLGSTRARVLWEEAAEARDFVKSFIETEAPEAEFRPGIIQAASTPETFDAYCRYSDWLRAAYGHETEILNASALATRIGTDRFAGGALDTAAGFCNPLALTMALARAAEAAGATIHEATEVQSLRQMGDQWQLKTAPGTLNTRQVLHACNGLGAHLLGASARRVLPLNNYIAVTAPLDAPPMANPVAVADDRSVVNYFWQSADGRLVYGGGESYGTRFPRDIETRVRTNLARVYPQLADVAFDYAWGGTLAVTATRLPFVAQPKPGLYTAGGYSGHGVALAPHAGRAVAEAIQGKPKRLELLSQLPTPILPGGRLLGGLITNAAMAWAAFQDSRYSR